MRTGDQVLLDLECTFLLQGLARMWEHRARGERLAAEVAAEFLPRYARNAAHYARLMRPDLEAGGVVDHPWHPDPH